MEGLPHRILVAYAKYHAVVLVMRLYESWAARHVSDETLDKLTMDTFACAKRKAIVHKEGNAMVREMVYVCWNANIIAYLADYSVHQVLLGYAYVTYIQKHRRKIKNDANNGDREENTSNAIEAGPILLSFMKRSTLLALSRGIGLACSSIGGAVGSAVWPGWGTVVGVNFGDSASLQLTEETDIMHPGSS
jgi:hypothetical protein